MRVFLVLSRYTKPIAEVERVLPAHRAFLDRCYAEGTFVVSGPLVPRAGGVIIAVAPARERVESRLEDDPFVREGICEYDVLEFEVTKQSEAWRRLFS